MRHSTTFSAAATLTMLATGLALPSTAAQAGAAQTAECTFMARPSDSTKAPAVVEQYQTPSDVPPGATAFTSPNETEGREYLLAPSEGKCVAGSNADKAFGQWVTLPGQTTPAFEQVFEVGGYAAAGTRWACRYLAAIRTITEKVYGQQCTTAPAGEYIQVLDTGMADLHAALVMVEPKVTDTQLTTSGTDAVLAVVLASDNRDSEPVVRYFGTPYADCRLSAATTDICLASLQVFTDEALAWQRFYDGFPLAGDPGQKIRTAIAEFGHRAGTVTITATPTANTQGPGAINTPDTRFTTKLDGLCSDFSDPVVTVKSDATGADVAPAMVTRVPGGFFDAQTGAGHAEARCPDNSYSSPPFTITAGTYVALGDSYASGEGAPEADFWAGTNGADARAATRGQPTGCHRAGNGYATQISRDPALGAAPLSLVACSGAQVPQIYEPNSTYGDAIGEYEPPQINAVDPATTKLATLSIGGNDSGFAYIVNSCIVKFPAIGMSKTGPIPGVRLGIDVDKNCRKPGGTSFNAARAGLTGLSGGGITIDAGDKDLVKTLSDVYTDIGTRMAPGGLLIVLKYPQLFTTADSRYTLTYVPDNKASVVTGQFHKVYTCALGTGGILSVSRDDAHWINSLAVDGNKIIDDQVAAAQKRLDAQQRDVHVQALSYDDGFDGHRLCDPEPYLNGARLDFDDAVKIGLNDPRNWSARSPNPYQTSVHPNADGQNAVAKELGTAIYNELHKPPAIITTNRKIRISAKGFTPGEAVVVELHSTPVRLGTFTADAAGTITATLTIPGNAPTGQHTVVLTATASHQSRAYPVDVTHGPSPWYRSRTALIAGIVLLIALLAAVAAGIMISCSLRSMAATRG